MSYTARGAAGRAGAFQANACTVYLARKYPPTTNHTYSMLARRKGFAPAWRNLSILVSVPSAVIAMVSMNVSMYSIAPLSGMSLTVSAPVAC